ncbi:MAG: bifunctional 5,10-methylenetetrahydrofolate dehydrogenase/5,10-methenyltetrahydrofolate cyclohydrolase [Candidatus Thermoplasmatota archaeon]|jgi:methylenetetrahydrofolate dehydrogenase (NADP+)/methenyltetrahydrofolate cyclohydrolase|nr:bifunctional 5,10-methylenetetrahydrofolate dehydrogenase/5,10-methenyltetrahydrofolate cyclohydrolase [Candidatus Thermoplasmatota archaeon]MCL5788886.1 bifunctional 5,10-methylenetetrahydrofolate dehydrogenase/5,10-methenyltetrahydrofolate cyclohydrolase [Candidatus Thermoplasmatota archaeon]
MILDGKSIAKEMLEEVRKGVSEIGKISMASVAYQEDQESIVYFNSIKKNAEKVGINFVPLVIKGDELMDTIYKINSNPEIDAVIVGRPFPKGITNEMVSEALDPDKDADCVTYQNMGQLYFGAERIAPATSRAAVDILTRNNVDLKGKNALIVNRSVTVGRPLSQLLLNRDATVTVAHSKTRDIDKLVEENDLIFLAVAKPGYLKSSSIKSRKIVVDIGINVVEGKVKGDFEVDSTNQLVDYSPVPGGVGAVTSVEILKNVLELAKAR